MLIAAAAVKEPIYAAVALSSLAALIFVHEMGHAAIAHRLGYEVHVIRLGLVHGSCEYQRPEYEFDETLIAWGGVAAQLLLAIPFLVADYLMAGNLGYLGPAVLILGYWNLLLIGFNLLPSQGLDGGIAWRVIPLLWEQRKAKRAEG